MLAAGSLLLASFPDLEIAQTNAQSQKICKCTTLSVPDVLMSAETPFSSLGHMYHRILRGILSTRHSIQWKASFLLLTSSLGALYLLFWFAN